MSTRQRFLAARFAYVAIVLLATMTQLHFSTNLDDASMRLRRAFEPTLGWRDAIDGLRNAVLFAGLGAVWVTTSLTGKIAREIRMATLTSFLLSATVETLQVFSPVRTASLIDVTTNTAGGLGGAIATALFLAAVRNARRDRSYVGIPTLLIAGPYSVAVLCEAFAPLFHSNPEPFVDGGPFRRLVVSLHASLPLDWGRVDLFDVPLFAAAGILLVAWARERRGVAEYRWVDVAALGSVTAALAHLAHGMVGLPVSWESIIIDGISITLGAWAASRWLGPFTQRFRGAARARAVIFVYVGLLAWWGLRQLVPRWGWDDYMSQLTLNALVPLSGLSDRVDVFSALHVAQQFLLYVPLGALLAVWPLRQRGRWSNLWPAVLTAVAIELGHIVVAGRTFDITNALLACSGLAMGWTIVRRCGYQPHGSALGDSGRA